jgi:hypothetical protein
MNVQELRDMLDQCHPLSDVFVTDGDVGGRLSYVVVEPDPRLSDEAGWVVLVQEDIEFVADALPEHINHECQDTSE